jgi:hypothetical protein
MNFFVTLHKISDLRDYCGRQDVVSKEQHPIAVVVVSDLRRRKRV